MFEVESPCKASKTPAFTAPAVRVFVYAALTACLPKTAI